jgi:hypothetical protein
MKPCLKAIILNNANYEQTPKRQRPKKLQSASSNVTTKESMRALVDALDPNILTPQVWIELVCYLTNSKEPVLLILLLV